MTKRAEPITIRTPTLGRGWQDLSMYVPAHLPAGTAVHVDGEPAFVPHRLVFAWYFAEPATHELVFFP